MKIFDVHTHVYPDKIAERAVDALGKFYDFVPEGDGTYGNMTDNDRKCGVNGFLLLCVATNAHQIRRVNESVAAAMERGRADGFEAYAFGGLHPCDDMKAEIDFCLEHGLSGIKLHPDYQHFFVDEPKMFPIYQKCGELGLPIIFHAGLDPVSPSEIHCTPEMAAFILDKFPDTTMIMAHLGGNAMWDEVEMTLAGRFGNLYMDTALVGSFVEEEQLARIIEKHGADKILLASDCPWDTTDKTIEKLRRIGLTPAQERMIFAENAARLLGLPG